jgi:hypothetical protein
MQKRIKNTVIGDVFCVIIDENYKRYLQYIISDLSQLNSDVVRAFKKKYMLNENPELINIVNDDVDFYAHCVTKSGIKNGYWVKVGNIQDIGDTDCIIFKDKKDYRITEYIQNDWSIWKVNEEHIYIGELPDKYKKAYIGLVFQPERIMNKLTTGSYGGAYLRYE